jgi:hypothetical protein
MGVQPCQQRTDVGEEANGWDWSIARVAARARGGGNSLQAQILKGGGGDDEEEDENGVEGEVTLAPHSPPHEDLCSLGNIFSRHARISIGTHRQKWPQTEIELSTSPPPLPFLTVVSPGL